MLKNLTQLEHKIGDKFYHFMCDPTSPLNEIKDALFHFLTFVGNIEASHKAAADQAAAAQVAPVVPPAQVEPVAAVSVDPVVVPIVPEVPKAE